MFLCALMFKKTIKQIHSNFSHCTSSAACKYTHTTTRDSLGYSGWVMCVEGRRRGWGSSSGHAPRDDAPSRLYRSLSVSLPGAQVCELLVFESLLWTRARVRNVVLRLYSPQDSDDAQRSPDTDYGDGDDDGNVDSL